MADLRTSLVPNKLLQIVRLYSPRHSVLTQPPGDPATPPTRPRPFYPHHRPATPSTPSAVKARDTRPSRHGKDRNRGGHGPNRATLPSSFPPHSLSLYLARSPAHRKIAFSRRNRPSNSIGRVAIESDGRGNVIFPFADRDNGAIGSTWLTCNAGRCTCSLDFGGEGGILIVSHLDRGIEIRERTPSCVLNFYVFQRDSERIKWNSMDVSENIFNWERFVKGKAIIRIRNKIQCWRGNLMQFSPPIGRYRRPGAAKSFHRTARATAAPTGPALNTLITPADSGYLHDKFAQIPDKRLT